MTHNNVCTDAYLWNWSRKTVNCNQKNNMGKKNVSKRYTMLLYHDNFFIINDIMACNCSSIRNACVS